MAGRDKVAAALVDIVALLGASSEPHSGRAIKVALAETHPRAAIESALRVGVESKRLSAVEGARKARLYRVGAATVTTVPSVPATVPVSRQDDSKAAPGLCTRRQLAELLGQHMQTVTKWEQDGMPITERGRRGKPSLYAVAAVQAWLEAREVAAQTGGAVDVARQRARKELAQAVLAEQTYQIRAKELLPRQDVEKAWAGEVSAVRTKLLSWSTTIADRVHRAGMLTGVAGVERELRDATEDVLRELADPGRIVDEDETDDDDEQGEPSALTA